VLTSLPTAGQPSAAAPLVPPAVDGWKADALPLLCRGGVEGSASEVLSLDSARSRSSGMGSRLKATREWFLLTA